MTQLISAHPPAREWAAARSLPDSPRRGCVSRPGVHNKPAALWPGAAQQAPPSPAPPLCTPPPSGPVTPAPAPPAACGGCRLLLLLPQEHRAKWTSDSRPPPRPDAAPAPTAHLPPTISAAAGRPHAHRLRGPQPAHVNTARAVASAQTGARTGRGGGSRSQGQAGRGSRCRRPGLRAARCGRGPAARGTAGRGARHAHAPAARADGGPPRPPRGWDGDAVIP